MRVEPALLSALAALVVAACSPDAPCPRGDLAPLERAPRFAVVASDYSATAVALLDADAARITDDWIDSGSTAPGLSSTLSGDVVLPAVAPPGELLLIDRLGVDVVTRIAVPSGEIVAQHRVAEGFRANPQDALALGGALYVSRFEPNLDPAAPPEERGSDLVVVDLGTGARTTRIDLSALDAGSGESRAYARPSRLVPLHDGAFVLVGLARLDAAFVPGPGATAVLDARTHALTALPLPELSNCGEVVAIPAEDAAALVLCLGQGFDPDRGIWYDPELRRAGAGIARVEVDAAGTPTVADVWRARDHLAVQPPSTGLIALTHAHALVVAAGDADHPDELLSVHLPTGLASVVTRSGAPFTLLPGALDPATRTVVVPDAARGLLRFDAVDPVAGPEVLAFDACHGLPPREVRLTQPL